MSSTPFLTYRIESINFYWGGNLIRDEKVKGSGIYSLPNRLRFRLKRNGQRNGQIFIVLLIVLLYSFCSAYLSYNNCVETDFPSSKQSFEKPDQDYLFAYQQSKWSALEKRTTYFILKPYFVGCLPDLLFEISSLDQKILFLRC